MPALIICKFEEDPMKTECATQETVFSSPDPKPYKVSL